MIYVTIPDLDPYPLLDIQDTDLFEVCYFDGTQYLTKKVSGQVLKSSLGGSAGGDLSGSYPDPTVVALQGVPISTNSPTNQQVLQYLASLGQYAPTTLSSASVGLENVQNIAPLDMPISNDTQNALDDKAPLFSPQFLGVPTTPTPLLTSNDSTLPNTYFVQEIAKGVAMQAVSNDLIGNMPGPTVARIQNIEVDSGTPLNHQFLRYQDSQQRWKHHTLTADDVDLGNVANLAPADLPISTATQTALNAKADIASPSFTGTPSAPTAAANTNTTQIATTAFVTTAVNAIANPNIPNPSATEMRRGIIAVNASATFTSVNGGTSTNTGSALALTIIPSENVPVPKVRLYTTAAASNSRVSVLFNVPTRFQAFGRGFRFIASFAPTDQSSGGNEWYVPQARQFVGLSDSSSLLAISSTVPVSDQINIIGVGSDPEDANLQIFYNDSTGVASQIDLGSLFPANKLSAINFPQFYVVEFYYSGTGSSVYYRVTEQYLGNVATGSFNTNVPAATAMMSPQLIRTSGASSQNVSMDIGNILVSSLF